MLHLSLRYWSILVMKHDETPVLAYIVEPCWTSCFVNHDFFPAEIHRFLCSNPTIGWTTHGLCWWKPMFHVLHGRQWGASAHSYSLVKDPRHCTGCAFWVGRSAFLKKVVDGPMAWNHDIPKGTIWLQFPGASLEQNIGVELPWKSVELQWLLVLTGHQKFQMLNGSQKLHPSYPIIIYIIYHDQPLLQHFFWHFKPPRPSAVGP